MISSPSAGPLPGTSCPACAGQTGNEESQWQPTPNGQDQPLSSARELIHVLVFCPTQSRASSAHPSEIHFPAFKALPPSEIFPHSWPNPAATSSLSFPGLDTRAGARSSLALIHHPLGKKLLILLVMLLLDCLAQHKDLVFISLSISRGKATSKGHCPHMALLNMERGKWSCGKKTTAMGAWEHIPIPAALCHQAMLKFGVC